MELALNLIWVCVAVLGCALLGSNLSRTSKPTVGRTSNRQKIIAMGCALIILFFVISMTDEQRAIAGRDSFHGSPPFSAFPRFFPYYLYLRFTGREEAPGACGGFVHGCDRLRPAQRASAPSRTRLNQPSSLKKVFGGEGQ
jgi:hypothetical protein